MAIKLNTGRKAIEFDIDNEIKTIYFNPTDPDLMVRFKDLGDKIEESIKGFENIELNEKGEPINTDYAEITREIKAKLCNDIDWAFNGNVAKVVFETINPFAIVNNKYFIEIFVEAVMPVISAEIQKANKKTMARMDKHIGKYKK